MFRKISRIKFATNPGTVIISSRSSHLLAEVNDEVCVYPPIIDMSREGQRRHQRQLWYDSIKLLPTVEQKLYELSLHHRPREKRYLINSIPSSYNGIFFQRYITRTHLIDHLPEKLTKMNVDEEFAEIADACTETVLSYFSNSKTNCDQEYSDLFVGKDCSKLVNLLILQCYKKLALKNDYILESTIQQSPRINSYWFHGDFESKKENKLKNLTFQYREAPSFVIRTKKPLNPILNLDDPICATADVPDYNYHPATCGFVCDRKWITSVPGHWFDDPCEFPFLLVLTTDKLKKLLKKSKAHDLDKIKDSVGLTSSFGWLNAAATYQGFTPYHDVTYPLVCQTILTNGQDWNFLVYQLNTIAFHSDVDNKDKRNICWSSGTIRLFDCIEDGQVKGFNGDVFKILLKFLLNAPLAQDNVVFKPYLGVANLDEEEFNSMRYFYRRMYSQAPDPLAYKHEIPTWQRIYVYNKLAKPMPFVKLE